MTWEIVPWVLTLVASVGACGVLAVVTRHVLYGGFDRAEQYRVALLAMREERTRREEEIVNALVAVYSVDGAGKDDDACALGFRTAVRCIAAELDLYEAFVNAKYVDTSDTPEQDEQFFKDAKVVRLYGQKGKYDGD